MEDVNVVMARKLSAAGLDPDNLSEAERGLIQKLASGIDVVLESFGHDPTGVALRIAAAALHSYAEVAENYAEAITK